MTSDLQTLAALAVVAVTATWFIVRAIRKRRTPGCSSDCGCEATDLKAKIKR